MHAKQLVQFPTECKRVPAIRSLDEKRHHPYGQGRHGVPVKPRAIEDKPKYGVDNDHREGPGVPVAWPILVVQWLLAFIGDSPKWHDA
jgi:hypothetical protein